MRNFKVYVDGELFHHPHISKLSITEAQISEDAENMPEFIRPYFI